MFAIILGLTRVETENSAQWVGTNMNLYGRQLNIFCKIILQCILNMFSAWKRVTAYASNVAVKWYVLSDFVINHNAILHCNHIYDNNKICQIYADYPWVSGRVVENLILQFCPD